MLRTVGRAIAWIEDALLVLVLVGLIGLASVAILLRNVFDTGFVWADELIRLMVLWLAVLGAVAASRADRHIRIDVLARLLPPRGRLMVAILMDIGIAALLMVLTWHSGRFVYDTYQFEDTVLGALPAWWFQAILPLGFGLMLLHQLGLAVLRVGELTGWRAAGEAAR